MGEFFEEVAEIPRLTSTHYEWAQKVIPAFVESGIKYARLTNIPKFECTFTTMLDTLKQVAIARRVRVIKRGDNLFLFNLNLVDGD